MRRTLTFLARRVAAGLFTIIAIVTATFALYSALPTQPAAFIYPHVLALSHQQVTTGNHLLGTDKPKLELYGHYLWQLLHGDFGKAWSGATVTPDQKLVQTPIGPELFSALRVTLSIAAGGALLVLLLAIPLGALAGSSIGSLTDRTISLVALVGICTHPMVVGLILRSAFGSRLRWAPATGYCPLFRPAGGGCGGPADWASHLVLPWVTFALLFLALYTRIIRASVAESSHEDYVRTARAKGAGESRVLGRHILPNAMLRVLTMIGMDIGTVIGVSIYIEAAYQLSGLGLFSVLELGGNTDFDLPTILAIVTVIATLVVVANLVVDTLYAVIDPRVHTRAERTSSKSLAGGIG